MRKIETIVDLPCPKLEGKPVLLRECRKCEYYRGMEDEAVVVCDYP